MELSDKEKSKVKTLSPMLKLALKLLTDCMKKIIDGECNETELCESMARLEPKENGYVLPEDYMTVDECMRLLNMDRSQFYEKVVNKNNLRITYFKNKSLGYKRSDIERFLYENRDKESKRIFFKNKRKKKRL